MALSFPTRPLSTSALRLAGLFCSALLCSAMVIGCGKADPNGDRDGDGIVAARDCNDGKSSIGSAYPDTDQDGHGDAKGDPLAGCDDKEGSYSAQGDDCNDQSAAAHPGETEICDGLDNDCNGQFDDVDLVTYYRDGDGDGHGDPDYSLTSCAKPSAYVMVGDDCDDGDGSIYPNADELCDLLDNDCNSQTDEGLSIDTFYQDADHDEYGDADASIEACTAPGGYVENNADCDDSSRSISPAALEACDGIDNDCNGTIDDAPAFTYYQDGDQDGYGNPSKTAISCSGPPPGYVGAGTDCNDADASIYPGAIDVCDKKDNNCNGQSDENGPSTYYTDKDGDGYGDSSSPVSTCTPTGSQVASGGDCNDNDSSVHPGAVDAFSDGKDANCNGVQDWMKLVAGDGYNGFSGDGGQASKAELWNPYGVSSDSVGNLYIADTGNNRIRKIAPNGVISTVAGGGDKLGDDGPASQAMLNRPYSVAVNPIGDLFIADTFQARIRRVNSKSGVISTVAGNGRQGYGGDGGAATEAKLNYPAAVAIDVAGNVFIADTSNNRIRKVTTTGTINSVAGDGSEGASGDNGQATSASLHWPYGVAVDASNNLYIADTYNSRIRKVDSKGKIITVAGNGQPDFAGDGGQAVSAKLNGPQGVLVDGLGNLFIADTGNNRIRKVGTNGIISTVAGNGEPDYAGDGGPSLNASIGQPGGIGLDSDGFLYIADSLNHRVRMLEW